MQSIMSGTYADGTPFDFSLCTTPFLYSDVIRDLSVLSPWVDDTDTLFGVGTSETGPAADTVPARGEGSAVPGGSARVRAAVTRSAQ